MTKDIDNIINVTDVASKGVVFDTPPAALAPNIMTNVRNVRFKDGAIRKMEGELLLDELEVDDGDDNTGGMVSTVPAGYKLGDVQYLAVWEEPSISPDQCYYITVRDYVLKSSSAIVGQKVFIQNAIKKDQNGYFRKDITPPIGTALTGSPFSFNRSVSTSFNIPVGTTTIFMSSTTNIIKGHYIIDAGLAEGTQVVSINANGSIVISKPTTAIISSSETFQFKLYPGFSVTTTGWGHTLFGGGFAFILNNGIDRPHHIKLEPESSAATDIELLQLPGWDSYYGHSEPVKDTWDADPDFVPVFALGQEVDFSLNALKVTRTRGTDTITLLPQEGNPSGSGTIDAFGGLTRTATQATVGETVLTLPSTSSIQIGMLAKSVTNSGGYYIHNDSIPFGAKVIEIDIPNLTVTIDRGITKPLSNTVVQFGFEPSNVTNYYIDTDFIPGAYPGDSAWVTPELDYFQIYYDEDTGVTLVSISGLEKDDKVSIQIRTRNIIKVSCGIIESFGNLIVAGNLKTTDSTDPTKVLRRQPGVIRVSDVAATDSFPTNWNPFASSVSTADEFTLSETSVVKDMKTLQSNFYIYSTEGIHQLRLTGNLKLPVAFSSVTETYGALSTKSVAEYDGRHFVVGKNDIYSFTGNPADIKSLCDNRTRVYFYNKLNPVIIDKTFVLANHRENEIWINYPTGSSTTNVCDEALIYNYRDNTWTIRDLNSVRAGDIGPVVGGGIPQSTFALTGNSGNAGFTNLGNVQVQRTVLGTGTVGGQGANDKKYKVLKAHGDIKAANRVTIDSTWTGITRNARQVIKFTWASDNSVGSGGINIYRSSSYTPDGQERPITWVLFAQTGTTKRSIGVTLTPQQTTLKSILNDIVSKLNNQAADFYTAFNTHYHARRSNNSIYIEATSTGPRTVFPAFSSGSSTEPGNGTWAYYQAGTSNPPSTNQYDPQNPLTNRVTLTNGNFPGSPAGYFPAPTITEEVAGTDIGAPEITATLTLPGTNYIPGNASFPGNPVSVYNMSFNGSIPNIDELLNRIRYYFVAGDEDATSQNQPIFPNNTAYEQASIYPTGGTAGDLKASFRARDIGLINPSASTFSFTTSDDTAIQKSKIVWSQDPGRPKLTGTVDHINFNFPIGENLSMNLLPDIDYWKYDPDYTQPGAEGDFRRTEVASSAIVSIIKGGSQTFSNANAAFRIGYLDNFGGAGQPIQYFRPDIQTGGFGPNYIDWVRQNADGSNAAGPNLSPISWTVTPGTARTYYSGNEVLVASSTTDRVTTNTGASPNHSTLTRATLKIRDNGVSTTVLDKRYGEGPGRLLIDPLSGINGAGESPYGSTSATTDTGYLALFYNGSNTSGSVPNGIAVASTEILADVVTALTPYSAFGVEALPSTTAPTSVVIKTLDIASTVNYVESFTIDLGAEATTAPVRTQFINQNREGQTVAGANSTLNGTITINNTLSNVRPWSTGEVNELKRFPIFAQSEGTSNRLRVADLGFDFAGTKYVSFFERDQLSITTTFNTETVNSMVLWADGFSREDATNNLLRATLSIRARGTNASGTESLLTSTDTNDAKLIINSFVVATDYKVDARVQGRFINYRIDDAALDYTAANDREWHVSGLQLETLKGGTR